MDDEFTPVGAPVPRPSRRTREPKAGKLKLSINKKSGLGTSTGGHESGPGWDRELDSDPDEPLAVEEQFILRVPPALVPSVREMVESRNIKSDLWFKFKDSRRGVFHLGNKLYQTKLVDLPTLVESQKMTGSGGASVKVADISQMLLVEEEVQDENQVTKDKSFNIEDFVYPHGITPPLKHVRKRRFRKRVNRRTIEVVENAVEKLLEDDGKAEDVQYELLDHDPSDSEYGGSPGPSSQAGPSSARGTGTSKMQSSQMETYPEDGEEEDGEAEEEENGSGFDSDLADEINKGLEAMNAPEQEADDSEEDEGGLFGSGSDDDEEDEEDEGGSPEEVEQKRRIKLLLEETGDLDRAIASKQTELGKATNPIFRKRFEDTIKKLTIDRDGKKAQHAAAVRESDKKKAGVAAAVAKAVEDSSSTLQAAKDVPAIVLRDEDDERMDES